MKWCILKNKISYLLYGSLTIFIEGAHYGPLSLISFNQGDNTILLNYFMNDLYWMSMEGHYSQYAHSVSRAQPFCLLEFGVLSLLGPGSWNFNLDQGGSGGPFWPRVFIWLFMITKQHNPIFFMKSSGDVIRMHTIVFGSPSIN